MRSFTGLVLLLPLLLFATVAEADIVSVGDEVRFTNRPGSPGGEFLLTVFDDGDPVDAFITFCLQKTEFMNFTSTFVVGGISDHADDTPDDPLDPRTAWLYSQFRAGTLDDFGYNYGPGGAGDATSANRLQNAIWWLEGEPSTPDQSSNPFVVAATAAGWTDIGSVRVLNLFRRDGTAAQDQLVLVPEPSSLALFASGILAVCLRRRRGVSSN